MIDDELYFVHQTAREFLVVEKGNPPEAGWKGSFQQADTHTLLALICIDYLLFSDGNSAHTAFWDYATCNWVAHCQSIEVDQCLANKVKKFLFQNGTVTPSFTRWLAGINYVSFTLIATIIR